MKKVEFILEAILIGVLFILLSVVCTDVARAGELTEPIQIIYADGHVANQVAAVEVGIAPDGTVYKVEEDVNPYLEIPISDSEFQELRWVLALEAQGEGLRGEIACCEAIFNRVLSSNNWGKGVRGVLSMRGQFATYKYIGSKKAWATPGELEDDAISECLRRGPSILPSTKYVYFDSKGGVNGRNHIKIGNHTFGAEA